MLEGCKALMQTFLMPCILSQVLAGTPSGKSLSVKVLRYLCVLLVNFTVAGLIYEQSNLMRLEKLVAILY